jgi:carbamoyltransferase
VNILGIWDGHDAGAALLVDGKVAAAANEERFTRRKLEVDFPRLSISACLELAGIERSAVDIVATTTSDVAKAIGRLFPSTKEAYYQLRRRKAQPGALTDLRRRGKYLITEWKPNGLSRFASRWALDRALSGAGLGRAALRVYDHHACHAAGAASASGFDSCLVVTIDGLGDGQAATVSRYREGRLQLVASTPARHSPGVFFEHVTHLLNMRELEDEGKVMALADYASRVADTENPMLPLLTARGATFLTAVPGRSLERPLKKVLWRFPNEQFASMAQRTLERACVAVVREGLRQTGERRVALAGGVASNIKVNRQIRQIEGVDDVFVFPHMGDGGLALGAALLASAEGGGGEGARVSLEDLGLGPEYSESMMEDTLRAGGLHYQRCADLPGAVGRLLAGEKIVMWFQGRMEYGPRALGYRSVLARPDRPDLRDRLNLVLKRRVWYQPFCPSILERDGRHLLSDFSGRPNRHMTMAYQVAPEYRPALSGVVSVDGSCRPQLVPEDAPGPFAALLREMRTHIGVGALLNTSFNIHGSPLVCSPREALDVFIEAGADALAMGPFLVCRTDRP